MNQSLKTNMNYLSMQLTCKPDVERLEKAMSKLGGHMEAFPLYDSHSEAQQEIHDRAEQLYPDELAELMRDQGSVLEALGEMPWDALMAEVQSNSVLHAAVIKHLGPMAFNSAIDRAAKERE